MVKMLRNDKEFTKIGEDEKYFILRKYETGWGGCRETPRATYQRNRKKLMDRIESKIERWKNDDLEIDKFYHYLIGLCEGMEIKYNDYFEDYMDRFKSKSANDVWRKVKGYDKN